ncbi:MAG: DsbA family protein [Gemmatimonadaceae bacterium]
MLKSERFLNLMTAIAATCTVVVTSIVVYRQVPGQATAPTPAASARATNRFVKDWDKQVAAGRTIGADGAPLTVLYYGDFECPACRAFTNEVNNYSRQRPGDLRVVFRHLPLPYHRFAYPSARAAECAADQESFEAMYQALYSAQDSLGLLSFHEIARRASVPDLDRFDRCATDTAKVERIERDVAAARAAHLPGTPGVIIGGMLYADRLPTADDLDRLVRDARAKQRE